MRPSPMGEGMNPAALDGDGLSCWEQLNATDRIPPLGNKWMRLPQSH